MKKRTAVVSGVLWVVLASGLTAQVEPNPDSLVTAFVSEGPIHNVGPSRVFDGCPELAPWQEAAFRLLASADLTPEREGQLAAAWSHALRECREAKLEQWYVDSFLRLFNSGQYPSALHWWAIKGVESDAIQAFLMSAMEDHALDERFRAGAGFAYFDRLSGPEKGESYLRAFERGILPEQVAWGLTTSLLMEDADALITAVGAMVRLDPELAKQVAFATIVESRSGQPSEAALRAFADDVRAAAANSTSQQHRQWLGAVADHLETKGRGVARGGQD